MYTVMLDLKGKWVVVVGGGKAATRRVKSILHEGALIEVISPSFTDELIELQGQQIIKTRQKKVEKEDLVHAFMVIIATNNPEVNEYVLNHTENQLVNSMHDSELGNIAFPAQFSKGRLSISVYTNGASPIFAKKIMEQLEGTYDDSYEMFLDYLFHCRQIIKKLPVSPVEKNNLLKKAASPAFFYDYSLRQKFLETLTLQLNN